jgi:NitT/TauT family transport system permease protein
MSQAIRTLDGRFPASGASQLAGLWAAAWKPGLLSAASWAATAVITVGLPDVVPWGSARLFAIIAGVGVQARPLWRAHRS